MENMKKNKEDIRRPPVSSKLHQKVKMVHEELKAKGIRGVTIGQLYEDLCMSGLEYQKLSKSGFAGNNPGETGIKFPTPKQQEHVIETKSKTL